MKKSFMIFVIFLVLAMGGIVTVNALLLKEKDAVVITENVVYGDKSVIDGVTVVRNAKYDDYIRWKTTYEAGENPKCHTEYDFSAGGKFTDGMHIPSGVELRVRNNRNVDIIENLDELQGLEIAYKELLDETEPGEQAYKIVSLADYEDYYHFELDLDLPGDCFVGILDDVQIRSSLERDSLNATYRANLEKSLKIIETFQELIKIPVLENHIYRIGIEKNMEGMLCSWGYSSMNGGSSTNGLDIIHEELPRDIDAFYFSTLSAMTDDICYFTFITRTNDGEIVDTSEMPQGYGIYAFEFDAEAGEIDVEGMKNVYPLDAGVYVNNIKLDNQQENLLIFTEYEDAQTQMLTVVDLATMQQKQQLTYANETGACGVYIYDDFMVVRYTGEKFVILSRNEDGTYSTEYSINIAEGEGINLADLYPYGEMVFDFNGEILLMSDSLIDDDKYYYNQDCGFYLAAFDENGLQYYGEYESSLDTGREYIDYYYNCMPTDVNPLEVHW